MRTTVPERTAIGRCAYCQRVVPELPTATPLTLDEDDSARRTTGIDYLQLVAVADAAALDRELRLSALDDGEPDEGFPLFRPHSSR